MSAAPIKVLVVDDEPPIRKLLRMGLSTQGYEMLDAPNGKTALALLDQKPDLVILDLGLPDIQGHELLRMIRARDERIPIVVLSSRGDEAGKVQALDLGADDYVTKPFGMEELLARVRAALGIDPSACVFAAFGKITAEKRIDAILRAFDAVATEREQGRLPAGLAAGGTDVDHGFDPVTRVNAYFSRKLIRHCLSHSLPFVPSS